jgi:hypothetical protein
MEVALYILSVNRNEKSMELVWRDYRLIGIGKGSWQAYKYNRDKEEWISLHNHQYQTGAALPHRAKLAQQKAHNKLIRGGNSNCNEVLDDGGEG